MSAAFLIASTIESGAFALLGPVQPWMQMTNGVIYADDIGGPMDISNEYRWNVPVVTYGFDQSFLDYFGTNGVAAVEGAIQILNNLPPASSLVLTNYPFDSQGMNYAAQAQGLYDLKSQTLQLLLEQLGLAQPTRYIFVLRQWTPAFIDQNGGVLNWIDWAIPDYIVQRNFDPQTFAVSPYVNDTLYTAYVSSLAYGSQNSMVIYPVDFFADGYDAVADLGYLNLGGFYTGLTYDDVGGLAYLLSTNNVNYETLLPGVCGVGANAKSFVNGAWRPGVDKITFVPQPANSLSGAFLPMTNCFTDTYFTNCKTVRQHVQRVIKQPDFLFSAADTGEGNNGQPMFVRTGTTNWINNAAANGNTNGAGPGVIQPQVHIVFDKFGPVFATPSASDTVVYSYAQGWASFNDSSNAPVVYPISPTGTNQLTVRMWLIRGTSPSWSLTSFEWKRTSAVGTPFTLQTSTNLVNWINLFTVTNTGSVCTFNNNNPASPNRFYRLIP